MTRRRVCENPRCAREVPDDRRPQAKYCSDGCKREASRIRTGTQRMGRVAREFWGGYGRRARRRPAVRG